jgi:hypothetical protein
MVLIMKIKISLTGLLLIFILPSFTPVTELISGKVNPPGPRITFSETSHDFGEIITGAEAVHYFVFTNTGESALVVQNVRTSCGCMASAWPKAPVAAGAKDSLKVEYNTRIRGSFNKSISVQTNAENTPVELMIKGNVVKAK